MHKHVDGTESNARLSEVIIRVVRNLYSRYTYLNSFYYVMIITIYSIKRQKSE